MAAEFRNTKKQYWYLNIIFVFIIIILQDSLRRMLLTTTLVLKFNTKEKVFDYIEQIHLYKIFVELCDTFFY